MNAEAGTEFLAVGDAVGQRVLEIAADIVVGLHRHDIRAIGEQQQIFGHLQMMRAGVVAAGEKSDGLQPPRIRRIEYRHAVAEHVADIEMTAIDHDLDAVRPSADIAVGNVIDAPADSLHWNRNVHCGTRGLRKISRQRQAEQRFQVFAAIDTCHVAWNLSPGFRFGKQAEAEGEKSRTNPSPEGRGWCEAPGEGYRKGNSLPLTRRFAAPSPFRRGIFR